MDREELIDQYKWEFLKRNEAFLRDRIKARKKLQKIGYSRYTECEYNQIKDDFWEKWWGPRERIGNFPMAACVPLFENLEEISREAAHEARLTLKDFYKLAFEEQRKWEGIIRKKKAKSPHIEVHVDLRFPDEVILEQFKKILRKKREQRDLMKYRNRAKVQFEKYERYLQIYDLFQEGWSRDEIVEEVFKEDLDEEKIDFDSAKTKVSRYYKKAKELIGGGYRDLR